MSRRGKNPDGVDVYPADPRDLQSYAALDEALRQLRVPVLLDADNPHDRLFIAAMDGTGNSLFKDKPENLSVVAKTHLQLQTLKKAVLTNITSGYVEGTFTQDNFFTRNRDGITGFTFDRRVETAYYQFCVQAKDWLEKDPDARIRIAGVGFSRARKKSPR